MLIFDELKKNDQQLRLVAVVLAAGLSILLAGLWWVQIVSARKYESHLQTQSYRTVRIPAVRGKILDRNGCVLAENRPHYNLDLYLDDLRGQFDAASRQMLAKAQADRMQLIAAQEKKLGRSLTKDERKKLALTKEERDQLRKQARLGVANNIILQSSERLGQPLTFDGMKFSRHYEAQRALPYPVLKNLGPAQIARFEEKYAGGLGVDLEVQPVRTYPFNTIAGHILGYLQRDDSSAQGEDAFFSYRLPDYRGAVGIEAGFDAELRGRAGAEAVLVNNLGYRQRENVWSSPEPGHDVVLTLDVNIEETAARSLARHVGADARGAVVAMDVRTGDVLAMVSSPTINPNYFVEGFPSNELARLEDLKSRPRINRATQENYAPGSMFKTVVGLACLENGLNPNATIHNPPSPENPNHGYIMIGRRTIHDLAPPGEYDFRRAIIYSCNTYFITVGLHAGIENVVRMAEKFHFGERTGLPTRQETKGIFPTLKLVQSSDWRDGDSANICIGQGEMAVTPMQMAVAYAAIANGGKVLWPRLVDRIEPQDPVSSDAPTVFPSGVVRDELGVHPRNLKVLHDAMFAEVEEPEGTGHNAMVTGFHICGKTGTAQVMDENNRVVDHTTWFASFAPYENPRYAVVVMVEHGGSGGTTCAPIAHDIYEAILKSEKTTAFARSQRGEQEN
jgi:penicillin-binding protein 2